MKRKTKTILIILIVTVFALSCLAYVFRFVIDYGCASPKLYSNDKEATGSARIFSTSFLGVRCVLWNKMFQFQENF